MYHATLQIQTLAFSLIFHVQRPSSGIFSLILDIKHLVINKAWHHSSPHTPPLSYNSHLWSERFLIGPW